MLLACIVLAACSDSQPPTGDCGKAPADWLTVKNGIGDHRSWDIITVRRAGGIAWNGKAISFSTLKDYLKRSAAMDTSPQLILHVEQQAKCASARAVRTAMAEAAICRSQRLCGEGYGWRLYATGPTVDAGTTNLP